MIELISVGRLSSEKGTHLLLAALPTLCQKLPGEFCFHFFGSGEFQKQVEQMALEYDEIVYHGHQPKEVVFTTWERCAYTVMPSLFLETFGLTALDSLSLGVPVICPAKGGLEQFIIDKQLEITGNTSLFSLLYSVISSHDDTQWGKLSARAREKYQFYTREHWYKKFLRQSGLAKGAKIALISDYAVDIGGIENWLFLLKKKLEEAGHQVVFIGGVSKKPPRWLRVIGLMLSCVRLDLGLKLRKYLAGFEPDFVWRHSVHRVLGPRPLLLDGQKGTKHRVMYHDFGLFHPYPSVVFEEDQIRAASGFIGYMQEGMRQSLVALPLHGAKYVQKKILQRLVGRKVCLHTVPSDYMKKLLVEHGIKEDYLISLPHFID